MYLTSDGYSRSLKESNTNGHRVRSNAEVVITGEITRIAVGNPARGMAEAIANAVPFAVLVPRALNLIRGGGRAPGEAIWK